MKFVYFGTSEFAVPPLERIAKNIALVVTQPDRPKGRGMGLMESPVKKAALRLGLQVETPIKCRAPEFVARLLEVDADAFIVASYGQILSQSVLDVPPHGCFNLHASILPRHRGASPIQSSILAGDMETGVTLMKMDAGLDTGEIVAISKTPIGEHETSGELHDRLAVIAADLIQDWAERIATGQVPSAPQDESRATLTKKLTKNDGLLDFAMESEAAYQRFRAVTPHPGTRLQTKAGEIKIKRADLRQDRTGEPGTVLEIRPELVVAFGSGALALLQVQPEAKRAVSGADFANGARIAIGDCLKPRELLP